MKKFMTVGEVAAECGVCERTIQRWAAQGVTPPTYKVGGRNRFKRSDVEKWTDSGCPPQRRGQA